MKISLPQNNKYTQPNKGDWLGTLWASWNLDLLSNPGTIKISPPCQMGFSNVDDADMVYPVQFVTGLFEGTTTLRTWAVCDKYLFKTHSVDSQGLPQYVGPTAWDQDAIANTPTNLSHFYSDGIEWNGDLIVSNTDDLHRLSAGTWQNSWWKTTLSKMMTYSAIAHPLGKSFSNLLLIGDGNLIHAIDTSLNITMSRLTFPVEYQVVWIRSSETTVYFGCRNKYGGRAKVFAWYGSSVGYDNAYKINGQECYAGVLKDEVPYTINERGELLALTGAGFTQIANLPVFNTNYNLSSNWTQTVNVMRNGMVVQDNRIHILLQASVNASDYSHLENQLSGIWVYDPEIGLHHRYSVTKDTGANITDYGSPEIKKPGCLLAIEKIYGGLLIGCSLFVADGATTTTIRHTIQVVNVSDTSTVRIGYGILPKIKTPEIEEVWQKIYLLFRKFLNATDKIVMKYRTDEKDFGTFEFGSVATWVSSTSFITTQDFSLVSVGDEIEIISGEGSGLSAHITAISLDAGTYTVTIDETVAGASGTMMVRVSNWTKIDSISNQVERFKDFTIDQNSNWVQFKIVLFGSGTSPELEKIAIKSNSKTLI